MKKKIELLDMHATDLRDYRLKINEIAVAHNTEQEEPTSGYVETVGTPQKESITTTNGEKIAEWKNGELVYNEEPTEKQEDWKEEWREEEKDIWYEVGGKRYASVNGEEYVRTKDVSQLLSERTEEFTLEELTAMRRNIPNTGYNLDNLELYRNLVDKLSNLIEKKEGK